jgi:hypothetical protein
MIFFFWGIMTYENYFNFIYFLWNMRSILEYGLFFLFKTKNKKLVWYEGIVKLRNYKNDTWKKNT